MSMICIVVVHLLATFVSRDLPLESPRCREKYSVRLLDEMAGEIQGRIAMVALLRNNIKILPAFQQAILTAADRLGNHRVFVSILESGSKDGTPNALKRFSRRLHNLSIAHKFHYQNPSHVRFFKEGVKSSGNRITYLAHLRNAVLSKALQSNGNLSKVVFLNDVILCGGDILRLLSHDVDMACAYDFNYGAFWDNWVYEKLPSARDVLSDFKDPTNPPPHPLRDENVVPVVSCWNGVAAFRAKPLYEGLIFRRGFSSPSDCAQSECSLFCLDMRLRGYNTIIADPTVQVFYQESSASNFRILSNRSRSLPSQIPMPTSWRCCELLEDGKRYINWDKCYEQSLSVYHELRKLPSQV